jgi:anaerobic magnesium-protoporphyrin IX monomethyl ester cyclase
MRILLLYPTWTGAYGWIGHFARKNSRWPPLNLALMAAVLEQHGHEVAIIDGEVYGMSVKELVKKTIDWKPDMVGLTAFSPFFHINRDVAKAIKAEDSSIPIAIGGPHITIMGEKLYEPDIFDFLFVGEAEKSFPQMLEVFEKKGDLSQVKGFVYNRDGKPFFTGEGDPFVDQNPGDEYPLDQFPFPARHLLPMEKYTLGTLKGRLNMTSIQTMRGCPWQCIFCASAALKTTRVIKRSPKSIVEEMKQVVDTWNVRHFYIVDDVMTLWPKHITEICDLIDEAGLDITFEGSTRANLINDEIIERLARSGLVRLSFGLETVDTEMRKTMKKKVPLSHYIEANKILNKYNVEALNSVMIGLPGETRETVDNTLKFLEGSRDIKQANFAITVPYPGTELHEMATKGEKGIKLLTDDFSEYRRYGSAVTQVNDLSPQDLIDLQNEGFVRIYAKPWRWKSVVGKHGLIGGVLMLVRVGKMVLNKYLGVKSKKKLNYGLNETGLSGMKVNDQPENGNAIEETAKIAAPAGHHGDPKNPNT